jgi:hypothetical protein
MVMTFLRSVFRTEIRDARRIERPIAAEQERSGRAFDFRDRRGLNRKRSPRKELP